MKRVRFTKAAEADVERAFVRYEGERPGLGQKFLERLDQAINQIAKIPLAARTVVEDVRRLMLRQFPFELWYRVRDSVIVIARVHAKRSPAVARRRALGSEY